MRIDAVSNSCLAGASVISIENQTLIEAVDIVGTPFNLVYHSDRVPGRTSGGQVMTQAIGQWVVQTVAMGGWVPSVLHLYEPANDFVFLGDRQGRSSSLTGGALPGLNPNELLVASEDGTEVYVFNKSSGHHLQTRHALTGAVLYQFTYDGSARLTAITDASGKATTFKRNPHGELTDIDAPFGQRTTVTRDTNGYLASITNPAGETTQLNYTSGGLLSTFTDPSGNTKTATYAAGGELLSESDAAGNSTNLSPIAVLGGFDLSYSDPLGRITNYHVEFPGTHDQTRVITSPSGLKKEITTTPGNLQTILGPDQKLAAQFGPDPRWGMQAPVPTSQSLSDLTGLQSLSITSARTASVSNSNDLFSLTSQTDTLTIGSRTLARTYDATTRTITETSPGARKTAIALDTQGRVADHQIPGSSGLHVKYDTQGRLEQIDRATAASTRTLKFTYDSAGWLNSITDPLGHVTVFGYDVAGRVIDQTLANGSKTAFTYDANGNLKSITPPGRPAHTYSYTPTNLISAYVPPPVGSPAQAVFTYNAARQLSGLTRPDGTAVSVAYDGAGRPAIITLPSGQLGYAYSPTSGKIASLTAPDGSVPRNEAFDCRAGR